MSTKIHVRVVVLIDCRYAGFVVAIVVVVDVGAVAAERLDHGRHKWICVASLVVTIILVSLYGWPSHITRVTRLVGKLASNGEDLVLHPRDAQLVLVLHAAKALLEITNIRPDIRRAVLTTRGKNVAHTTARGSAMAGKTPRVRAGLWRNVLLLQRTRSGSGIWTLQPGPCLWLVAYATYVC